MICFFYNKKLILRNHPFWVTARLSWQEILFVWKVLKVLDKDPPLSASCQTLPFLYQDICSEKDVSPLFLLPLQFSSLLPAFPPPSKLFIFPSTLSPPPPPQVSNPYSHPFISLLPALHPPSPFHPSLQPGILIPFQSFLFPFFILSSSLGYCDKT